MSRSEAELAHAKINLALHVRARNSDGYHAIETLFAFARDGDRLTAERADRLSLALIGPFAGALAGEADNLVLRAARALQDAFGVHEGAAILLDKQLPVASGIGGGSADAAAALRMLARLWGLPPDEARMMAIARTLGADVPACLVSRPCRGEERGDRLDLLPEGHVAGTPLLLVNPGVAVSTAQIFADWGGIDGGPVARGDAMEAALAGRNDLEALARVRAPVIGRLVDRLGGFDGVRLARMSGSGATCFALFASAAACTAAHALISRDNPDWWCLETVLL